MGLEGGGGGGLAPIRGWALNINSFCHRGGREFN